MKKYTSPLKGGRAAPCGIVTRKSRLIRVKLGRKHGRVLPMHLQVLPQRLKPTPVHPQCLKKAVDVAQEIACYLLFKTNHFFLRMGDLEETGRYRVILFDEIAYTDNFKFAYAWQTAAIMRGFPAEIEDTTLGRGTSEPSTNTT